MNLLEKNNVEIIMFFPFLCNLMTKSENFRPIKSVRLAVVSGSVISEDFIEKTKLCFPNAKVFGAYASTEGGLISASNKIQKSWSSGVVANGCKVKVSLRY